jgi:WD40 repeat protein
VAKKTELWKLSHAEPIRYVRARGEDQVDFASRLSLHRTKLGAPGEPTDLLSGAATGYDVIAVADTPDGNLRATSHYKSDTIYLWSSESGAPRGEVRVDNDEAHDVTLSRDGRWFSVCGGGRVHLFDLRSSAHAKLAVEDVTAVAFSPDSRTLAAAGFGKQVVFWDVATRRETRRIAIQAGSGVSELAFSPDGSFLAVETGGDAELFDLMTGKKSDRWSELASFDYALDLLAVTNQGRNERVSDGQIRLVKGGRVSQPFRVVSGGAPLDLADESRWLAGRQDDEAVVWDERGNEKVRKSAPGLELLALTASGKSLAIGQREGWVTVFDTSSGNAQMSIRAHPGLFGVSAALWTRDGRTLVTAGHDGIKFWAPARRGDRPLATMRVTSDGWYLVTSSDPGSGPPRTAGFSKAIVSDVVADGLSGGFYWEALRDDSILAKLLQKGL